MECPRSPRIVLGYQPYVNTAQLSLDVIVLVFCLGNSDEHQPMEDVQTHGQAWFPDTILVWFILLPSSLVRSFFVT